MRMTLVEGVLSAGLFLCRALWVALSFVLSIIMGALTECYKRHYHYLYPGVLSQTCLCSVLLWGHRWTV